MFVFVRTFAGSSCGGAPPRSTINGQYEVKPEQERNPLLSGNTSGLKAQHTRQLEKLENRKTSADSLISPELARAITELSRELNRQIGLLIDRRGRVNAVVVGDAKSIFLPDIQRRGRNRLCGLRLVHTHLNQEPLSEDDLTDLALLRLDCVTALGVLQDGLPGKAYTAHLMPANVGDEPWTILPPQSIHDLPTDFPSFIKALEDEFARQDWSRSSQGNDDRAIVVHISDKPPTQAQDSLDELRELARSAGIDVVHEMSQRRTPDPKFVMGKGKLKFTIIKAMQLGAELLIFDLNLTPSQMKSVSEMTDLKVMDRSQLILDIFALHAVTREGKLQVELALLRYRQPFLGMKSSAFSRLTGGIGGRGPGETKLEVDRRRASDRIARLEREVNKLGDRRELRRGVRHRKGVPTVAVVGYTNAGKSTLLNHLTNSHVTAEDALFATLNPVSRRIRFPQEREVVITDTVGFIRDLPKDLMAAFRTTFEELHEADLLLHVMDASCPDLEAKYETVANLLRELELDSKPIYYVLNKMDKCDPDTLAGLTEQFQGFPLSALDRETFGPLLNQMEADLWSKDLTPAT